MAGNRPFKSFPLLSFDIYGTLIDWEAGILQALKPLATRLEDSNPLKTNPLALGSAFNKYERQIQNANPQMTYNLVLKASYENLARELQSFPLPADGKDANEILDTEGTACGESIAHWPAFPDTVAAMRKLKARGYKLVPVSNIDRESFSKTLHGALAGLHEGLQPNEPFFDAVYTAQDIGSYKPDLRNFEYLISHVKAEFGVAKDNILHVAQSLYHDHEPAKKIGLQSVWIARGKDGASGMGGDAKAYLDDGRVAFGWKFDNLAEFAEAIEREKECS